MTKPASAPSRHPAPPKPQPVVSVEFHGIATGGEAVGRDAQNRVVFAPYGAPGDTAMVRLVQAKKQFARGEIVHLQSVGSGRTTPPCPYYPPAPGTTDTGKPGAGAPGTASECCGGCQLQHLTYEDQLEAKTSIVTGALARLGGLGELAISVTEKCLPSAPWAYRNKADFVLGVQEGKVQMGYFSAGSHTIVDVEFCPLQCPQNNTVWSVVRRLLAGYSGHFFDPRTGRGELRRVVLRTDTSGGTLVTLVTGSGRFPLAQEFARDLKSQVDGIRGVRERALSRADHGEGSAAEKTASLPGPRLLSGQNFLVEEVAGRPFRVTGDAFFQVNTGMTPLMVETARRLLQNQVAQRILDLYCGAGLFGLSLAGTHSELTGVELHPDATVDARFNARTQGVNAQFFAGDTAEQLGRFARGSFDLVVIDPPRAGAGEAMAPVIALDSPRLLYISCDPATLARDARTLGEHGYTLARAVPLDLFPQTAHVETVALFQREGT